MSFVAWPFFWAGLACAAAPLVIHLLNRRRFRVVQWAAMDFLRQALQRNRRIMQLRDLLLLLLRSAAVLLFGMALAQPLMKSVGSDDYDPSKPLHAVLIVDNSLSMGYQEGLDATLLDKAKDKAEAFIKKLPAGSRITVAPLCGAPESFSLDPYRTADDALGALRQIQVVHRATSVSSAANLATKAIEAEPSYAKRVVVLSDQQRGNWAGSLRAEDLKNSPEMQLVDVAPSSPENSWISDFRLDDGIADVETPARFTVRLRHQGPVGRKDVQVTLWVGDAQGAPRRIDLEPGSAEQEVVFRHTFSDIDVEPGKVAYVPVRVELASDEHDRLSADNQRHLIVPVVAALPVVFVDQTGAENERPSMNQYGETRQLRRLLVPVVSRGSVERQLVRIEHVTIDQVNESLLADARLVVIAGIEDPGVCVDLLREYVQQGGQLFIAAGGQFSPVRWNQSAWLDGQGILPAPLNDQMIGHLPGSDGEQFQWFELAYNDQMAGNSLFRLSGVPEDELKALYSEPFFFQA
ncbi:MAG: BatA domain-containing protein, partial [Planctomycetales bacterium]|nr:BatA domain-containing protein [Planctomycetales bacterium]